jgi:hypothetical protein
MNETVVYSALVFVFVVALTAIFANYVSWSTKLSNLEKEIDELKLDGEINPP